MRIPTPVAAGSEAASCSPAVRERGMGWMCMCVCVWFFLVCVSFVISYKVMSLHVCLTGMEVCDGALKLGCF